MNEDLVERLSRLDTGVVSDVMDEAGFFAQVPARSLRAVAAPIRFAGFAVCLRGEARVATRTTPPAGALASSYAVDQAARPGAVLVVATGGFEGGAFMGGLLAREMKTRGLAGLVTDGLVRDAAELADIGLPVVAAGLTPVNGTRRWSVVERDAPVTLPGQGTGPVTVRPGDLLLGDADGLVVVPGQHAQAILAMAEELARKEARITASMAEGASRQDAFATHERFGHIDWLRS